LSGTELLTGLNHHLDPKTMKQLLCIVTGRGLLSILLIFMLNGLPAGCIKAGFSFGGNSDDTGANSANVIDKWLTLHVRLMQDVTGISNSAFSRYYAYAGIVALETLEAGLNKDNDNFNWNGKTGQPVTYIHRKYFWPASINAGLATIIRRMFPNASEEDKFVIDSLEAALNSSFTIVNTDIIGRSNSFGSSVGTAIFSRAEIDGSKIPSVSENKNGEEK
jgi:hypothetical protein